MARSIVRAHPNSVGPSGNLNVRSGSKPEKLNESKCFPLFTQQRTSPRCFGMSVSCHERTHAPQQTSKPHTIPFDHHVGSRPAVGESLCSAMQKDFETQSAMKRLRILQRLICGSRAEAPLVSIPSGESADQDPDICFGDPMTLDIRLSVGR
jgi:hypothetical protein